jgi:transcription elongation factor Elf1
MTRKKRFSSPTRTSAHNASCPQCGSFDVVSIMYGLPSPKGFDEEAKGKIVLGGCDVGDGDPQKHCKACGTEFDLRPPQATGRGRLKK